jgi:tRNA(fMet)-specific endonuclease VapC
MYLLDTNVCIALLNGRPQEVRVRLEQVRGTDVSVAISSVVAFELWYGVGRSTHRETNARAFEAFLAGPFEVVPFDEEDARAAGRVRAELAAAGTPIGAYDILIAGQAVCSGATLVTADSREFARVRGLAWEDWTISAGP